MSGSQLSQFLGEGASFVRTSVSTVGSECVRGLVQHAGGDLDTCARQLHDVVCRPFERMDGGNSAWTEGIDS